MYCVPNFVDLFLLLFLFLCLPLCMVGTLRAGLTRSQPHHHKNLKTQKIQFFMNVMLENEAIALLGK